MSDYLPSVGNKGWRALRQRINRPSPQPFESAIALDQGHGFRYRGISYFTHTQLPTADSAWRRLTGLQGLILVGLILMTLVGVISRPYLSLVIIVSLSTALYFIDLLFVLYLVSQSFIRSLEVTTAPSILSLPREWPVYTVLCPLYQEWAVIPQFIAAMSSLDYPKDRLEVMLLLEADDQLTRDQIAATPLADYFEIVVVPTSQPRTKPKACNYGLAKAKGEYCVIFDAEDIPEPDQLKKAVLGLEAAGNDLVCLQAKLNYYNTNQNILTRLFTLEYSLWFDLILTGLQYIEAPIPLGGTSNHFRTRQLRELQGWDPFNVTEDADLGMRIAKLGYRTAVLNSTTMEEANSNLGNWLKQRSRWIKGYVQTYLVHMRRPKSWRSSRSALDVLTFQLVVGGKPLSMLINPLMWILTISYFVFRPLVGGAIESVYQAPTYYVALFSLVIGNFLYMYYYMLGAARRGQWELMGYVLLVPFYWLAMSVAAVYALWDLAIRPHYWHKTRHGLHLMQPAVAGHEVKS